MGNIENRECCFRTLPANLERLIWELTFKCTLNCAYCFQARTNHKVEDSALEQKVRDKVLNILPELGVKDVLLTGGEPLSIGDELFNIISYLKSLKINWSISTVARPLPLFKKIVKEKPRAINLSIDPLGASDDTGAKLKNRLEHLDDTLGAISDYNIPVKVTGLITKEIVTFEGYFKLLKDLVEKYPHIEAIYITNPYHIGYQRTDLSMSANKVSSFLEQIRTLSKLRPNIRIINFLSEAIPLQRCPAGQSLFAIEPSGDVVACPYLYQISQSFAPCNVLYESPDKIRDKMLSFQAIIENRMGQMMRETKECQNCEVQAECYGGCYAETFAFQEITAPQLMCRTIAPRLRKSSHDLSVVKVGSLFPIRNIRKIVNDCGTSISSKTIEIIHDYVFENVRQTASDIAHNIDHVNEVVKLAQYIGRKEAANLRIVIPAAYFHDFEPRQPPHFHLHTDASASRARNFLKKLGFSESELIHITHCIIASSYFSHTLGILPQTIEAAVVRDADWLDSIGARGIARVFGFSGAHCENFGEYIGDPRKPKFSSHSLTEVDKTPFYHFDSKLLRINDLLLTETGKNIGFSKHEFMVDFINRYKSETLLDLEKYPMEIPMKASIEYEIKSYAPSDNETHDLLGNFEKVKNIVQRDVYYDNDDRQLFKQGIYVRIRNENVFDIKYNPNFLDDSHLSCEEYSFDSNISGEYLNSVARFLCKQLAKKEVSPSNLLNLFNQLDLSPFCVVEKDRSTYKGQGVYVNIDDVSELGHFIEIEVTDPKLVNYYREFAAEKGLKHIPTGYVELYLRKQDFDTYLKGRYLLLEDRNRSMLM